ncbi:MAG: AMP-binding protein, partial [Pseudomonadales bacterium]
MPSDFPWLDSYPEGIDWKTSINGESLAAMFDRAIARHRDRTAIEFLGKTISYGELDEKVDQAASGLAALGVKKGTHVGLLLPNCPGFVVFFFAILKCGGTVVNCNPLYTVEELEHQ